MEIENAILFFNRDREQYGKFSNFSDHPITFRYTVFPTVEHYYQSCKTTDIFEKDIIIAAKTPGEAKRLGRQVQLREGWEENKYAVLKIGVMMKFLSHADLAQMLLSTKDKRIIEDSPTDYIWGIGADGTGKNLMGRILQDVRYVLKIMEYGDPTK